MAGLQLLVRSDVRPHPDLYPDPETFDPGRWESPQQVPRHSFIPFGVGARKCIGDSFVMIEDTLALAEIVSRWRLEHEPGHRTRLAVALSLKPSNLRMRVVPRSTAATAVC
ncbi:cytochrome P450 [Streptomyces spectabilis]|uniref:cytochrome P450 n=1 Tax=Streptomyces spectabilis TaxID=68270 RepID=UPI0033D5AAAB